MLNVWDTKSNRCQINPQPSDRAEDSEAFKIVGIDLPRRLF